MMKPKLVVIKIATVTAAILRPVVAAVNSASVTTHLVVVLANVALTSNNYASKNHPA